MGSAGFFLLLHSLEAIEAAISWTKFLLPLARVVPTGIFFFPPFSYSYLAGPSAPRVCGFHLEASGCRRLPGPVEPGHPPSRIIFSGFDRPAPLFRF